MGHLACKEISYLAYKIIECISRMQVQSRTWPCGHSHRKTICNCGVAVRENSDVIVMDMCEGIFNRTSLQVSIRSRLPLAKGIEITEANNGKRFTVGF